MQRQRRDHQVERRGLGLELLERSAHVDDGGVARARAGLREHALGEVHGHDLARASRARLAGEVAHAAAEVQHARVAQRGGQQALEGRPLVHGGEAELRARQARVAREELRVVVDVLRAAHR